MQNPSDFSGAGTSAGYRFTVRAGIQRKVGTLGRLASAVSESGGTVVAIDMVQSGRERVVRDITIDATDEQQQHKIAAAISRVEGVQLINVTDRTFFVHQCGKLEVISKRPLKTRDELSMAYTPGVARVSKAIAEDKNRVFDLTIKCNTVAVVTDGSAVLGLGNIGAEGSLPVMEGKCVLFKEFAGVDAFPVALTTQDTDEIVETVKRIAPVFGAVNLEDIAAPACFEIEDRLTEELDIPVFHDDQHGTAIVVAAGLINAAKVVGKKLEDLKVVVSGVGAAGVASTKIMMEMGVKNIIGCDRIGAIYRGRTAGMNPIKEWYAQNTNPSRVQGTVHQALEGADFFLGVSAPRLLNAEDIKRMAKDPIVFALANPTPEIMPEEAEPYVAVLATGRSDYPNQVNNVLAFPGLFRGALDCRARKITPSMNLAAAQAIAGLVSEDELNAENIIPSVFDRRVAPAVATAVVAEAKRCNVARKEVLR